MKRLVFIVLLLPVLAAADRDWQLIQFPAPADPSVLTQSGVMLFHPLGDDWIGGLPAGVTPPPGSRIVTDYDPQYGDLYRFIYFDASEPDQLAGKVHLLYQDRSSVLFQATAGQLKSLPPLRGAWFRISTAAKPAGFRGVALDQTDEFHPLIETLVPLVSREEYTAHLQGLEDFVTRNTYTEECDSAACWMRDRFLSYGLDAWLHAFDFNGLVKYNVVAELPGLVHPDSVVFITGHYDATIGIIHSPEPVAPGADDNGSGTAAAIECARVLSQYNFENTIRFVAFAGEEQGMVGSNAYVDDLFNSGEHVIGCFNYDLIAYAGFDPLPPDLKIYINNDPPSGAMADMLNEAIETFLPGALEPEIIVNPLMYYSDHSSFWSHGYPAMWGIEAVPWGYDFNPNYHTADDLVINCDMEYATNCTKAALAALAQYALPFESEGPYLVVVEQEIAEVTGNGNGVPEPRETIDLVLTLQNYGNTAATDIEVSLASSNPYIDITQGVGDYPDLDPGASSGSGTPFQMQILPDCPLNTWIELELQIRMSGGYEQTWPVEFLAGDPQYQPVGPDAYGYSAYDPNDYPHYPVYDWVEISADSGGPGTRVNFTQNNQTHVFDLPFTFGYYGRNYDRFTVAANGWIGMGEIPDDYYINYYIPSSSGPPAMIAPYWRDLSPVGPGSGGVWYWYDETNHRLIVEYDQIEESTMTGVNETFQIILEDQAYNPASLGDGRIRFQYRAVSSFFDDYGTIGIEDSTQTMGVQYFFNGAWAQKATPVEAEFVILFVPPEIPLATPVEPATDLPVAFTLHGVYPNPFNPTTTISFDLPKACRVSFEVFDVNGRRASSGSRTTPTTGKYSAGHHSITIDGSGLPSGIYFYRLTAGEFTGVGKMVLLK